VTDTRKRRQGGTFSGWGWRVRLLESYKAGRAAETAPKMRNGPEFELGAAKFKGLYFLRREIGGLCVQTPEKHRDCAQDSAATVPTASKKGKGTKNVNSSPCTPTRYAGRSSRGYTLVPNAFADSGILSHSELSVWQWFKGKSGDGP
jgi:hypothetical protein